MILQSHTEEHINQLIEKPTHGVMLSGPIGAGKSFVAKSVAARLLITPLEKLDSHPYFKPVKPEKGSLGIDQIRELQKFLLLKVPGTEGIRRVAVIEDAHLMTNEAQNALLKSLEEPPADTVIILTAPVSQSIKETIYSRVRQIQLLPVTKVQAVEYFKKYFKMQKIDWAYALSGGQIGLMHALLNDQEHQLASEITEAKNIISSTRYNRLKAVDELSKQKDRLPDFLLACRIICTAAMQSAAVKSNTEQIKRWHHSLENIYRAESSLPSNPNPKLLLTDLMLNL